MAELRVGIRHLERTGKMTLSPPGDPTHLVKQMLPKVQRSSVAGMWRFAGLAGVIAASLALAGCGERRPAAGMRVAATGGYALVGNVEAGVVGLRVVE